MILASIGIASATRGRILIRLANLFVREGHLVFIKHGAGRTVVFIKLGAGHTHY